MNSLYNQRAQDLKASPINWLIEYALTHPECISLAAGLVEEHSLPVEEFSLATQSLMALPDVSKYLQYGTTAGLLELKLEIKRWIEETESTCSLPLELETESLVVTNGSQQLLYLISELLFEKGDIVLIESPSYFVYSDTLATQGVEFITIETDEYGLIPSHLESIFLELESESRLEQLKMLYTIPWCQNPSGSSRSISRLKELEQLLSRWVLKSQFLILEDAAYRSLCFNPENVSSTLLQYPSLKNHVAYATTFSKPFAPGVKLGAGILPRHLLNKLTLLKGYHDFGTSNWNQAVLWQLLKHRWLHAAKDRVLHNYQVKARILYDKLSEELGENFTFFMPSGGMYLWVKCPDYLDTSRGSELFKNCLEEGVLYVPGEYCDLNKERSKNSMRLSFGRVTEDDLLLGAIRLIRAILRSLS